MPALTLFRLRTSAAKSGIFRRKLLPRIFSIDPTPTKLSDALRYFSVFDTCRIPETLEFNYRKVTCFVANMTSKNKITTLLIKLVCFTKFKERIYYRSSSLKLEIYLLIKRLQI